MKVKLSSAISSTSMAKAFAFLLCTQICDAVSMLPNNAQHQNLANMQSNIPNYYKHLRYRVKFDSESGQCFIVTPEWTVKEVSADSYAKCLSAASEYYEDLAITEIDMLEQAQDDYEAMKNRMDRAIQTCIESPDFPALTESTVVRIDSRVKEFPSTNTKLFARIQQSTKDAKPFIYAHTMNDIIGFRVLTPDQVHTKQLMQCFEAQQNLLHIVNSRTRDGLSLYASGVLPNAIGLDGEPALYEIQIWPFAIGTWMIWQHDAFYKGEHGEDPLLKDYKDSVKYMSRCLGHSDFYSEVFPYLKDKTVDGVKAWGEENCLAFLAQKKIKTYRKIEAGIDLNPPPSLDENEYDTVIEDTLRMAAERGMLH